MPELPEVEAMRRLAERHCVGRSIARVAALEAGGGPRDGKFDSKVIGEGVSERQLTSALLSRTVRAARRWGKHLWLELDGSGPHLMFHCGMTGSLAVDGVERFSFQSFKVDEEWPPRFTKLQLELTGGRGKGGKTVRFAFTDPRRFGHILLRQKPMEEPPISLLAPDPIASPFPLAPFAETLRSSAAPVKAVLLDQEKAVCGVGNWVADEVLHKAGVHPAAPGRTLSDKQLAAVHGAVLAVLQKALAVEADADRFPKGWLFHCRWKVGPNGSGVTLPDGTQVAFSEVGGRTTAFVPSLQRMGDRPSGPDAAAAAASPRRRAPRRPSAAETPQPRSPRKRAAQETPAKTRRAAGGRGSAAKGKPRTTIRKRPAAALASFEVPLKRKRPSSERGRFKVSLPKQASLDLS